jgi:hypothetical protein
MSGKRLEDAHETDKRITLRWKVMLALGAVLLSLGLVVDWPPPMEPDLPETSSFLIIIGGLLGTIGLLTALRGE